MKFMVRVNLLLHVQYNLSVSVNLPSKVFLIACIAVILSVVDCAPFNGVGPFYNGNAASAPSFAIKVNL